MSVRTRALAARTLLSGLPLLFAACGEQQQPWPYEVAHLVPRHPGANADAPIEFLVPGFEAQRIPVELPNVNNVRYRADGTLVAMGYNGRVYLLRDTDGDGLEDDAREFLREPVKHPVGLDVTPPGFALGDGVLIAGVGKVALWLDVDGDDVADREVVIADGWEKPWNSGGGTDAFGAVFAPDGSIYYGVGTTDFSNPYLRRGGRAHYDPASVRGAIHVARPDPENPDGRWRSEKLSTGVRFSVGLALNAAGDLFATDQEGSTWLKNGNPFDELLHIQRGRHYGFPPRHPRFLPDAHDAASLYDYGPQHQCTCGLVFNEGSAGGAGFGPDEWRGDALVAGFSRGRLFRTPVAKTPEGYVARNVTWAVADTLIVDQCLTPDNGLVVAGHGGDPDWGSGPQGVGALFKVRYTGRDRPQPVIAWAAAEDEVRVAFDRPLPAEAFGDLSAVELTFGDAVRAGDRFETKKPGYQARQEEGGDRRFRLPVKGVSLADEGRTVVVRTDPHPSYLARTPSTPAAHAWNWFALRLPVPDVDGAAAVGQSIELDYTLTGVVAHWQGEAAAQSVWLPHTDLGASHVLTRGSAAHEAFWARCREPGRLTMKTQVDLPAGDCVLRIEAPPGSSARVDGREIAAMGEVRIAAAADRPPVSLELVMPTGSASLPTGRVTLRVGDAPWRDPVGIERLLLPWVSAGARPPAAPPVEHEPVAGGFVSGRDLFLSQCSACHLHRGVGNPGGPNLDNLVHRDRASVIRDIREPSAAINPDYVTHEVKLADGNERVGFLTRAGEQVAVTDAAGVTHQIDAAAIESLTPTAMSTMPDGLAARLGETGMAQLLDHLMLDPVAFGRLPENRPGWPPARDAEELAARLRPASSESGRAALRLLLLGDASADSGGGLYEFFTWQKAWQTLLGGAPDTKVVVPNANWDIFRAKGVDLAVCYRDGVLISERAWKGLAQIRDAGKGLVFVNAALRGDAVASYVGLSMDPEVELPRTSQTVTLRVEAAAAEHPILAGLELEGVEFLDQLLPLRGDRAGVEILAMARAEDGSEHPALWTHAAGDARVVGLAIGQATWTYNDPLYRRLLFRAMAWAARQPPGRFDAVADRSADLR